MAKATKNKNKSNQPSETASASNTDKTAGLSLSFDDIGIFLTEYLMAAYKAVPNLVQEPHWGIVPVAKKPAMHMAPVPVRNILAKQQLTCLITAVTPTTITVEALIDRQQGIVETRRFDKLPLLGVVDCQEGTLFNLTITTKPGSREFIYEAGNPADIRYFEATVAETTHFYNELQKDSVFQEGPVLNDDGDTF